MFLSAFMLFVPVAYERYDKFVRLARALKEVRVGFILTGVGLTFSLLIASVVFYTFQVYPENYSFVSGSLLQFQHGHNLAVKMPRMTRMPKVKATVLQMDFPDGVLQKKPVLYFSGLHSVCTLMFLSYLTLIFFYPFLLLLLKINPSLLGRLHGFPHRGLAFWKASCLPRSPIYTTTGNARRGRRGRGRRVVQPCTPSPSNNSLVRF